MKKLLIFLFTLFGLCASAQSITGTWEIFPNYGTPKRLIETPEFVYTLAGNGLCGYDKATGEVMALNVGNRLNGNKVENIWYDPDKKCLLVAYTDYNIDLVFDDGRTINVPDLRDAAITSPKTIRSAAFNKGKAYVGISSGMLVIDMDHGAVIESCIWDKNITRIMATDNKILLTVGFDGAIKVADQKGSHHNFDSAFTDSKISSFPTMGWIRLGENSIVAQRNGNLTLIKVNPDATDNSQAITSANAISGVASVGYVRSGSDFDNLQPTKNGIIAAGAGNVYYITPQGEVTTKAVAEANSNLVADWNANANTLWLSNASGYGCYSPQSSSYAIARTKPQSTSGTNVGNIFPVANNTLILATATSSMSSVASSIAANKTPYFDRMINGNIEAATASGVLSGVTMFSFAANPLKDNEYLAGGRAGLIRVVIENGNAVKKTTYTASNSPIFATVTSSTDVNHRIVQGLTFDSKGNLWVITQEDDLWAHYISAEKWNSGNPQISDWQSYKLVDNGSNYSSRLVIHEPTGLVITSGRNGIIVLNPKTKQSVLINNSNDSDGMSLSSWFYPGLTVDKTGAIWFGSNIDGVFYINNPADAFNSSYALSRPKVARNDGTNLADYLLSNVEVSSIFVDESNQKWIGTIGSGLYRVSADGTQILDQFTTENSDIPSDIVVATYIEPGTNKVYIGTDQGLCIYHATYSPATSNYNDVYAYPNPVTPDYTGWITISGLMENSLVKIADASGRVFFEGNSDGGICTWNGCDSSGNRVKSGVYFVFASQHNESQSSAAVTKIVVIN